MYDAFMGQCAAMAAFMPVTSLNDISEADPDCEVGDLVEDASLDLEANLCRLNEEDKLHAFLNSLPVRLKVVTIRYYWDGMTQAEIADDLGITQSAIAHALKKVTLLGRVCFGVNNVH